MKKTGRKKLKIDWKRVDKLIEAGCLGTEIASYLGIHHQTFYDKVEENFGILFTEYVELKRPKGDANIREVQYNKAIAGDNALLIWLGKNRLNQTDSAQEVSVTPETMKNFKAIMNQLSGLQSESHLKKETSKRSKEQ